MDAFAKRLSQVGAEVEAALDAILTPTARAGELARPARLMAAMRYSALGGGKRLRPFLTIETARELGLTGLKVACVEGDDVTHLIGPDTEFMDHPGAVAVTRIDPQFQHRPVFGPLRQMIAQQVLKAGSGLSVQKVDAHGRPHI